MLNRKSLTATAIFFVMFISTVFAEIPTPLLNVTVSAQVAMDSATGIYSYSYEVYNPPVNSGQIRSFDIDVTIGPQNARLNWEGLIQSSCYSKNVSEHILQKINIVPVGIDGPPGYVPDFPKMRIWDCGFSLDGTAGWGSSDDPYRILPGKKLGGFKLTSHGLPGIREATLQPAIDYDNLPPEYWENVELTKQLQDNLVYKTKTIGPTAPPADFKPIDFLDYIVSLKQQSYNLGWIIQGKNEDKGKEEGEEKGIMKSLDKKLANAREKLVEGDTEEAVEKLNSFIHEVEALFKGDKEEKKEKSDMQDADKEHDHITSAAYALLKYNAQYLIGRLGGTEKEEKEKKD